MLGQPARASDTFRSSAVEQGLYRLLLTLLILQAAFVIGAYLYMAPRGFEFTDEAFYFLSILYWREITATVIWSGAVFEPIIGLLGLEIAGSRILALVMLVVSFVLLQLAFLSFLSSKLGRPLNGSWPLVLAAALLSVLYFSMLGSLRVPSYNLLVLCSAAGASACLFTIVRRQSVDLVSAGIAFAYGLCISLCFLSKVTSGGLLVVAHCVFLRLEATKSSRMNFGVWACVALLGALMPFAYLFARYPLWINSLLEGVDILRLTGGHGLIAALNGLRWDLQRVIGVYWFWGLIACLILLVVWRYRASLNQGWRLLLFTLAVGALFVALAHWSGRAWWLLALAASLLLAMVVGRSSVNSDCQASLWALCPAFALLLSMPMVLSFGTNLSMLSHSRLNAPMVAVAVLGLLQVGYWLGGLTRVRVAFALMILSMSPMLIQARLWTDRDANYRLLKAQSEQNVSVTVGSPTSRLYVDSKTAEALARVAELANSVGWVPGQRMFDFTGDSPGWLVALGARPVGVAWLIGGYPGSDKSAARLIEEQPAEAVRSSWILSSEDSPVRIGNWQTLIQSRVGHSTHQVVGVITVPRSYQRFASDPEYMQLTLWRPVVEIRP